MPTRQDFFDLDAETADARLATERALAELGWMAPENGDAVRVLEDPAGLCCSMAPVRGSIQFHEAPTGTRVEIQLEVPGFGGRPKRQLADRAAGLEQRIRRWAREVPA